MTHPMSRWIDRSDRTRAGKPVRPASPIAPQRPGEDGRPIGSFRRWLRGVPWRHLWILIAVVLLLGFALFGWFPNH